MDVKVFNESGKGYWMEGVGLLRAEGENRPSRPTHVICFAWANSKKAGLSIGNSSPTIKHAQNGNPAVCYAWTYRGRENGCNVEMQKEISYCLREPAGGGSMPYVCVGNGQIHQITMKDKTNTLDCMHDTQIVLGKGNSVDTQKRYMLRRLTPKECARLQGFPDWWTDGVEGSDSAKYKMWGNGIALPCAADVIGRLTKELEAGGSGDQDAMRGCYEQKII